MICIQLPATLFILPCFRMFSNSDTLRILIPEILRDQGKFLYYSFQQFSIRNISSVNVTYYVFEFIDKTIFFLTIFDDGLVFVLNKFLADDDVNY